MKYRAQHVIKLGNEDFKLIIEDTQDVRALLEQRRQAARHAQAQAERQQNLFPGGLTFDGEASFECEQD